MSLQDVLKPIEENKKIRNILKNIRIINNQDQFFVQKKYWIGWHVVTIFDNGNANFFGKFKYDSKNQALRDIKDHIKGKMIKNTREIIPVNFEDL